MKLNPSLDSLEALYHKLEREIYRAYHERDKVHKADHFYNFCITAHAMRDYFFEHKGSMKMVEKKLYKKLWNENEFLVAVADIANTSKHFTLRNTDKERTRIIPKTKMVHQSDSEFVDIYINDNSEMYIENVTAPDCIVTLENGVKYDLYSFTKEVENYWEELLKSESIPVRKQSLKKLIGDRT